MINYRIEGITNKKYLRGSNFDVNIFSNSANGDADKKLNLYINLQYIGTSNFDRGIECTYADFDTVDITDSVYKSARTLRNLIDNVEQYADNNFPAQYSSNFQKFWVLTKMFLGIL